MSSLILISMILLIFVLAVILAVVVVHKKKQKTHKKPEEPDYRAFFILGISLVSLGITFTTVTGPAFISFIGAGICFMAIGLAHRDSWEKKEK